MLDQKTFKPRTIFCHDNLPILRGINSNSIDLIYLDPPFNKGKAFHAPIGTTAEGASFDDIWSPDSVDDAWHNQINDRYPELYKYLDAVGSIGSRSAKYYLIYMGVRLMEMRRILKDTGSVYLHCDTTASHYLKLLMDTIFGYDKFGNDIIWHYYNGNTTSNQFFGRKHDVILFYTKTENVKFCNVIREPHEPTSGWMMAKKEVKGYGKPNPNGKRVHDVWKIPSINNMAKERTGYPTQKPLKLLERIIKASSNKGDIVLDPFCGCATTCIAAENLEREWVGIDVSAQAYELVKMRLDKEVPPDLFRGNPIFRKDIPKRTDIDHKRTITTSDKKKLFGEQGGTCNGCGTLFEIQHFEIDHIIPKNDGGSNELENLQLLCGNCNRIKGDRPMDYLMAKKAASRAG